MKIRSNEIIILVQNLIDRNSTEPMSQEEYQAKYDEYDKEYAEIINKVKGVNRVVYDISSKPPATIEWE
mgnify:CR=1 FL=1